MDVILSIEYAKKMLLKIKSARKSKDMRDSIINNDNKIDELIAILGMSQGRGLHPKVLKAVNDLINYYEPINKENC